MAYCYTAAGENNSLYIANVSNTPTAVLHDSNKNRLSLRLILISPDPWQCCSKKGADIFLPRVAMLAPYGAVYPSPAGVIVSKRLNISHKQRRTLARDFISLVPKNSCILLGHYKRLRANTPVKCDFPQIVRYISKTVQSRDVISVKDELYVISRMVTLSKIFGVGKLHSLGYFPVGTTKNKHSFSQSRSRNFSLCTVS